VVKLLRPTAEARAVEELASLLYGMVERLFGNDPALRRYVERRVAGARELLVRRSRLKILRRTGPRTYRAVFESSTGGLRSLQSYVAKKIDGGNVLVEARKPVDVALYFTEVSPWMLRCTCPDSLYASSIADNVTFREHVVPHPIFSRYCLCKHVITLLAILASRSLLDFGDVELKRSLLLGLLAAYIRVRRRLPEWAYNVLRELHGATN
jgi:hypothetical protein